MERLAGRFRAAGTIHIQGRGVVVLGDIIEGDVRNGDRIAVPLDDAVRVSALIESVGFVTGGAADSPIGLYVGKSAPATDLCGKTLEIFRTGIETTFDEAVTRFDQFLARLEWPRRLIWLDRSSVLTTPKRVTIFRPFGSDNERNGREAFDDAAAAAVAVRVDAVGHDDDVTFAVIRPIHELAQGEEMLIEKGVKLTAAIDDQKLHIEQSRLAWWLHRRADRKRSQRQ